MITGTSDVSYSDIMSMISGTPSLCDMVGHSPTCVMSHMICSMCGEYLGGVFVPDQRLNPSPPAFFETDPYEYDLGARMDYDYPSDQDYPSDRLPASPDPYQGVPYADEPLPEDY